jgi:hypothetical protein
MCQSVKSHHSEYIYLLLIRVFFNIYFDDFAERELLVDSRENVAHFRQIKEIFAIFRISLQPQCTVGTSPNKLHVLLIQIL